MGSLYYRSLSDGDLSDGSLYYRSLSDGRQLPMLNLYYVNLQASPTLAIVQDRLVLCGDWLAVTMAWRLPGMGTLILFWSC